jgi:RimJ/RimL family protein N-acetyltransferase
MLQLDPKTWQLETERLILRAPQPGEGALINEAVRESFEQLHPWMAWAREMPSVEETEAFSKRMHEKFASGEIYDARWWSRDGVLVGCGGFWPRDRNVPSFEIGYWCRTGFTRQGYTAEVVRALCSYAFETFGAQRLEILCDSRNNASRRVAEKCGFALEAILHHESRANDGNLRDTCIFARFPPSKL